MISLPSGRFKGISLIPSMSCAKSILNRNTVGCYHYVYFKSIKISTSGSIVAPVFFPFDNAAIRDANVMANGYRKTVNTV
jgi:hypothetical protein